MVEGHHTSLQDPESPVSEVSRRHTEEGDNESEVSGDHTLDQEASLNKITP